MPVSVELRTLNRAARGLRVAVTSLRGKYGDVPTVLRLRNDLERLELDVHDVCSPPPTGPGGTPIEMHQHRSLHQSLGGYRGASR
jgi:hypothetical protein